MRLYIVMSAELSGKMFRDVSGTGLTLKMLNKKLQ